MFPLSINSRKVVLKFYLYFKYGYNMISISPDMSQIITYLSLIITLWSVQFSSVAQPCLTLCNHMNHSMPGLPIHHQLPESTQICVHWDGDAIQPSHPLSSFSPPALTLSQLWGLYKWVSSSHQVANVLEFQLQHQSFQWISRTDFL